MEPSRPTSARFQPPPPPPRDAALLSRVAVDAARRAGFVAAGVAAAGDAPTWDRYSDWLAAGRHAEMAWLVRDAAARRNPESILPWCRSILSVAYPAGGGGASVPTRGGDANVARYARGEDYHVVVRRLLQEVARELRSAAPGGTHFRACVDTAPLLEREIAVRAGLGFIGKNGLLIVPGIGSHVVLGELLTDVDMAPTAATLDGAADRCGACTRCLTACPGDAFVAPAVLDAARCASYLTIEKRGPFTRPEAAIVGDRLFGCDVCQDVCPWNAVETSNAAPLPLDPVSFAAGAPAWIDPEELLSLDEQTFEARFGTTALRRATRDGLVRNAATLSNPAAASA